MSALAMFHLAVVLESGDVVGGGLDTQDEVEFVVDLDRGLTETMLDADALDPRRELAVDLLGELGSDLVAEEGGDVFGPRFRKGRLLTVGMACRECCS